jgi:perosamine synthetase
MQPEASSLPFIPVNEPLLNGNESLYLQECIRTGWISSEGPFIEKFESAMASKSCRKYGIAVTNGSAALEAGVNSLGIGPGDEVILPSFTIISCAAAIIRTGAIPVLVDACPQTWNMNTDLIRARITARTKAIMVVHIYGMPTDMDHVLRLASEYGLKVIEDAAEVHGQTYRGRPCGSFGDLSIFSFYPNKHITTGEGGMILTDDPAIAERCKSLRNLCFKKGRRFVHDELGWNLRMTNLQAALGLAQLERLDQFVLIKRRMGAIYRERLSGFPEFELQAERTSYSENIYWVFGVVLADTVSFDAEEAARRLTAKRIGTRPFFWPMHEQPVFHRMGLFDADSHPVSERISRRGFYLPSGLALSEAQIQRAADALIEVVKNH